MLSDLAREWLTRSSIRPFPYRLVADVVGAYQPPDDYIDERPEGDEMWSDIGSGIAGRTWIMHGFLLFSCYACADFERQAQRVTSPGLQTQQAAKQIDRQERVILSPRLDIKSAGSFPLTCSIQFSISPTYHFLRLDLAVLNLQTNHYLSFTYTCILPANTDTHSVHISEASSCVPVSRSPSPTVLMVQMVSMAPQMAPTAPMEPVSSLCPLHQRNKTES